MLVLLPSPQDSEVQYSSSSLHDHATEWSLRIIDKIHGAQNSQHGRDTARTAWQGFALMCARRRVEVALHAQRRLPSLFNNYAFFILRGVKHGFRNPHDIRDCGVGPGTDSDIHRVLFGRIPS